MERPARTSTAPTRHWIWAITIVVLAAMLIGAGLVVFLSLRDLPVDVVDAGGDAIGDLREVVEAFSNGTITTTFVSHATEVSGGSYFQFAKLSQVELFERKDAASAFWGRVALPEVVVQATAPVEYTYVLDLNGHWEFHRQGERIRVVAPEIEYNKPAVDASEIRYEVRSGSMLRDEDTALARLKEMITDISYRRARENVPLVRELGRKQTAEFVRQWLAAGFADGDDYAVEVTFRDELPPPELELPPSERELPPAAAELPAAPSP